MVTKAQVTALDGLLDQSLVAGDIHKRTFNVLVRNEWVTPEGRITQAGLGHTTYPTNKVKVVVLGKDTPYGEVTLPKGTEILLTFVHRHKKYGAIYDGVMNVGGKQKAVRLYKQPHMTLADRLMPAKEVFDGSERE